MPTIKKNDEIRNGENQENQENNQDGVASALDVIRTAQQKGARVMEIGPGGATMNLGIGSDGNPQQQWEGDIRESQINENFGTFQPVMQNSTEDILSHPDEKKETCFGQTFYVMGDKVLINDDKYEKLIDKQVESKKFGKGKIVSYIVKKKGTPDEFANIEVQFQREDDSYFSAKYDLDSGMGLDGSVAGIIDLIIPDGIIPEENPGVIL